MEDKIINKSFEELIDECLGSTEFFIIEKHLPKEYRAEFPLPNGKSILGKGENAKLAFIDLQNKLDQYRKRNFR